MSEKEQIEHLKYTYLLKGDDKAKPVFDKAVELFGIDEYILRSFRSQHEPALVLGAISEYLYNELYFTISEIAIATNKSRPTINSYRAKMWHSSRQEYFEIKNKLFDALNEISE